MLAYRIRLWTTDLIKDTVIWVGSGVALYFSVTQVRRQPHFFRGAALTGFKAAVFIEFYVNLYVFPFLIELILLPMITMLLMLSLVAGRDEKTRDVKRFIDALTALNVHTRLVGNFVIPWPARLTGAASFHEARRIVRDYRESMRGGTSDQVG